jgi:hypothetical protein
MYVPAGQVVHVVQVLAFVVVLNEPDVHVEHTRSVVAEPAELTYVPAAQVAQVVHDTAFAVVENEPLAHEEQVRSVVALPVVSTAWPAAQLDHAVHVVADAPSLSHEPLAQATFGEVPPGQYVPVSHDAQTGGLVAVPTCVWTVPASQDPCAVQAL